MTTWQVTVTETGALMVAEETVADEPVAKARRSEATVVLATVVISALNYGYTMLLVWLLPASEYAVVGSVSALLLICGTVAGASSPWVLAREVAQAGDDTLRRRSAVSFCLLTTFVQGLVAATATALIASRYSGGLTVAATFAAVLVIFMAATSAGYLQGLEQFRTIAVLRIGEVVVKIAAGVALVAVGVGVGGAIAGFALGAALVAGAGLVAMRRDLQWVGGVLGNRDLWLSTRGLMAIQAGAAILASMDIVLAGLVVQDRTAVGTYQAAQILGRVPVYVGAALSIVLFPRLVAARVDWAHSIRQVLILFARVCLPVAFVVATLPVAITERLFPPGYSGVVTLLPWAAAAGLSMGAVNLVTTFFQAGSIYGRTTRILTQGIVLAFVLELTGIRLGGVQGLAPAVAVTGLVVAVALVHRARRTWPGCTSHVARTAVLVTILLGPLAFLRERPALWVGWAVVFAAVPAVAALLQLGPGADSSRPRVLHLGFEDPQRPGAGGGSVRTHEINRALAEDFDVRVVCCRYPGSRSRVTDGVRYVHIGLPIDGMIASLGYFLCIPWALLRYSSDLVVEDFAAPFSSVGVPWMTRRPVIGVVQWLFATEKSSQYHLPFDAVERIGLSSHRRLIAVSEELGDELRRRNPRADTTVVLNGLDEDAFTERDLPRRDIAYLGRLEIAQKGLDLLLSAYASVADRIDQHLLLGGDGPDRPALERLVADLGIEDRVHFVGRIDASARFAWLASADFVAMPSRYESFGMVAAEALAQSTPVVAFDIPCLRALVGDEVGIRVPAFDEGALAEAIAELGTDGERRAQLGHAGPAVVAGLHWDQLAREQAAVYRQTLQDAGLATLEPLPG